MAGTYYTYHHTAAGGWGAFITGPNGVGMTDLSLLAELPAGYVLAHAIDINNKGHVLVAAAIVPEPEAYALMLAGLGLIGILAPRRKIGKGSAGDVPATTE